MGHVLRASSPQTEHIASLVVQSALIVHKALGPGLLESVYEVCLAHELRKHGLSVERQVPVPILYDGLRFEEGFRIDLLAESTVICEIKAALELHPIYTAQLMTHLRLTNRRLGFLINFNVPRIRDGIQRVIM